MAMEFIFYYFCRLEKRLLLYGWKIEAEHIELFFCYVSVIINFKKYYI